MKVYRVTVEYMDPVMGDITLWADSEEEACNTVRNSIPGYTVEIKEIVELTPNDLPEAYFNQAPTTTVN